MKRESVREREIEKLNNIKGPASQKVAVEVDNTGELRVYGTPIGSDCYYGKAPSAAQG